MTKNKLCMDNCNKFVTYETIANNSAESVFAEVLLLPCFLRLSIIIFKGKHFRFLSLNAGRRQTFGPSMREKIAKTSY